MSPATQTPLHSFRGLAAPRLSELAACVKTFWNRQLSLLCSRSGQSLPMFPIPTRGRPVNPREQKIWTFWKRQTKMWRFIYSCVRRKSVSQPAIQASCSWHVLAHKSFQLVPKPFLISRIDYKSFCNLNFPQKQHLPVGQVKNKNH